MNDWIIAGASVSVVFSPWKNMTIISDRKAGYFVNDGFIEGEIVHDEAIFVENSNVNNSISSSKDIIKRENLGCDGILGGNRLLIVFANADNYNHFINEPEMFDKTEFFDSARYSWE